MTEQLNINNDAEKKVLCKLVNNPNLIFDIENVLKENDFFSLIVKKIFSAIKSIAISNAEIKNNIPIDPTILEEKVASLYPEYYKSQSEVVKQCIDKIFKEVAPTDKNFVEFGRIILNNSIRRKFLKKIDALKDEINNIDLPDLLINHIETSTLDFTSELFRSNDIEILGENFESWIASKVEEVKHGKIHVGIKFGFNNYEQAIGGGFRKGTINVIAARSKMGKSFLALIIADNVAKQGIPVLYLDTELDSEYQSIRRMARNTRIPIHQIENAQFIGDNQRELLIKNSMNEYKKNKIHYVIIKGWNLEQQISIIRRFFAKIVGKDATGKFNHALVILDYLKLMSSSDKNADKEYEALGYRMTAMHDLMSEFQNPMLALVQQNRDGLEKEDESTVSGSDRIIHYCDNFTIFSRLDDAEILMRQSATQNDPNARKPENCKFKVVCCRHGPGTKGKKFIGVYADIHDPSLRPDETCGIIEERSLQTVVISK